MFGPANQEGSRRVKTQVLQVRVEPATKAARRCLRVAPAINCDQGRARVFRMKLH